MPCGKDCTKAELGHFRASVLSAYDTTLGQHLHPLSPSPKSIQVQVPVWFLKSLRSPMKLTEFYATRSNRVAEFES